MYRLHGRRAFAPLKLTVLVLHWVGCVLLLLRKVTTLLQGERKWGRVGFALASLVCA